MKSSRDSLFLHEEILLLAPRDREGTIAPGPMYSYVLGGALLAELFLAHRVRVEESGAQRLLGLVSSEAIGEPLLNQCLDTVAKATRRAALQTWVARFAGIKQLTYRVAEQLWDRGILRAAEAKVLGVSTRKIYPDADPEPERRLIDRLKRAILSDSGSVDARTVVLVSLAHHAGLLELVFDKKQLAARKARIEQMISGEATGQAAKQAIEDMEAAMMVTIMILPLMCSG